MTILTCIQGTNAELFENAFAIYGKDSQMVLDVTWGKGVFWKNLPEVRVVKNDIDPLRGDTSYDSRDLPDTWENKFDFVVYDPPYMHGQKYGTISNHLNAAYNNNQCKTGSMDAIREMYHETASQLFKVTKHKGIVAIKCADAIESGKQRRLHMWVYEDYTNSGFRDEDLFILMTNGTPMMRWKHQKHARKNNSYLWIFRVWKK